MIKLKPLLPALAIAVGVVFSSATVKAAEAATPSAKHFSVNGDNAAIEAYVIDGVEYVKLRDLASAFKGTKSEFAVSYDDDAHAIVIAQGDTYEPKDTDLKGTAKPKNAVQATSSIQINGNDDLCDCYIIDDGTSLFNINDLYDKLGFSLYYDTKTNTAVMTDDFADSVTIKGEQFGIGATEVDLENKGLTSKDIEPLKYLVRLQDLNLSINEIDDVTPLSGLTELRTLRLPENHIKDLKPLKDLTKLNFLSAEQNEIEDISPLAGLTEMAGFYLSENKITSIAALKNMTLLEGVDISGNGGITDLTPIADKTNISHLGIVGATTKDFSFLADFKELDWLWAEDCGITDITPLAGLPKLTSLSLSWNDIADVSPLKTLPNLTMLSLNDTGLTADGLKIVGGLTNLMSLDLGASGVTDLTSLKSLTKLNRLWLWGNKLTNIDALAAMPNLADLNITGGDLDGITDISVLAKLPKLEILFIGLNNVSDLTPLSKLTQLTELILRNNNITDITPLKGLVNLEVLYLHNGESDHAPKNAITDVSVIEGMTKLNALNLSGNPLTDETVKHLKDALPDCYITFE